MAFDFDRHTLRRLSSAVAIGAMVAILLISTARVYRNEAAWYDHLVLSLGGVGSYLVSMLWLLRRWLQTLDQVSCDDKTASRAAASDPSPLDWRGSLYPYRRATPPSGDRPRLARRHYLPGNKTAIAPPIQQIDHRACHDLQLLDTQWAELCQHQVQARYLRLLKHGVPPQEAYNRALTGDSCTLTGD